jgi:glycosyltransferase involved in cell wall biosynthesis
VIGIRSRLRVAVVGVNYTPEPSGIAPYTTEMCRGLAERGHRVKVFTSHPHYPRWAAPRGVARSTTEQGDGVEVVRLRHYVPSNPTNVRRLAFELHFGSRAAAARWGRQDALIVVSPALLSSTLVMARARALGWKRPAIGVVVQDLYSLGLGETGRGGERVAAGFKALEGRVLRGADGVVAIHDRFRERMVSDLGVKRDAVSVIRNWTHIAPLQPFDIREFRSQIGWRDNETVVLHAGAMGSKQGLENVVAAARLAERRGVPVRLVLMGDGGERAKLERAAAGAARLNFVDPLPSSDFTKALAAADILLVNERPALLEMAVPSKLTSYFSSGRPVVAATDPRSTTAAEVTAAGAGEIVPPGDPEALLSKILELRSDPVRADALGANGPGFVDRVLRRDTALTAYEEWVNQLVERRRRRSGES